jgi:hypothetical protein
MVSRVDWGTSRVAGWLDKARDLFRPESRLRVDFQGDLFRIIREDHERKMFANVTRYGQPRAPLARRTLANPKRGPGPSLIPRGRNSRYLTTFRIRGEVVGKTYQVTFYFENFVAPSGFPIPVAHEHGARRGNWVLPARPVQGITPRGMQEVDRRIRTFMVEVTNG